MICQGLLRDRSTFLMLRGGQSGTRTQLLFGYNRDYWQLSWHVGPPDVQNFKFVVVSLGLDYVRLTIRDVRSGKNFASN